MKSKIFVIFLVLISVSSFAKVKKQKAHRTQKSHRTQSAHRAQRGQRVQKVDPKIEFSNIPCNTAIAVAVLDFDEDQLLIKDFDNKVDWAGNDDFWVKALSQSGGIVNGKNKITISYDKDQVTLNLKFEKCNYVTAGKPQGVDCSSKVVYKKTENGNCALDSMWYSWRDGKKSLHASNISQCSNKSLKWIGNDPARKYEWGICMNMKEKDSESVEEVSESQESETTK
jgi:hypothetical protein